MASAEALGFHQANMQQERERVMLRIMNGTKASSPQILNVRRSNQLFYSNPLPDNSSGSKNRPFGLMKDESGRPDAMEQVAMKQQQMKGGVLRNYQYAKQVLNRRARDTTNIDLAAQDLPTVPAQPDVLTPYESKTLELETLLQGIVNNIDLGNFSQLTINELKNIPRLLISIVWQQSQGEIVNLIRIVEDVIDATLAADIPRQNERARNAINEYLINVRNFLDENLLPENVNRPIDERRIIAVVLAKKYFNYKITKKEEKEIRQSIEPDIITTSSAPPRAELGNEWAGQDLEEPQQEQTITRTLKIRKRPTIGQLPEPVETELTKEQKEQLQRQRKNIVETQEAETNRRAQLEEDINIAYRLAGSTVEKRRNDGLAILQRIAKEAGASDADIARASQANFRVRLKNLIERNL